MKRKTSLTALVVILAVIVSIGLFLTVFRPHPASTPVVSFSHSMSTLNTKDMNVTQGATVQVNFTFTERFDIPVTIPLESLKIVSYKDTINLNWQAPWNLSIVQERVFNYRLSPNQLTLQPLMSNSTVLTINLADNAPIGSYELALTTGKIKDEISGESFTESIPIEMIVTPKPNVSGTYPTIDTLVPGTRNESSGTIDYWLDNTFEYQMVNGQWETMNSATNATSPGINIPMNCRNDGSSTASFDLIISFTNAVYGGSSNIPRTMIMWNKINDTSAKYSFNIGPHETQSINVSFAIDNNTDHFAVSLSFESSQKLHVESAQKGSAPWQVVYRTLYYGRTGSNLFAPAQIS